jgi:hypothetical protein
MPFSAYVNAGLFVVAAAAALFAAAGTVAVPGFWAYLAILAAVMIVSFAMLDPDLLRERMRPGGKKLPLSLRIFSLVMFMHWIVAGLDRGRFHWSDDVPGWLQGVCFHGRGRLCPGTMGDAREPVFLLSHSHPDRPRSARCHHGTLRLRPPSRIHRRDSNHSGKRTRARIVARGRAPCDLQPAVSAPPHHHGGSNSSGGAVGLLGLRRAGPMAASPGRLVRAKPRLNLARAPKQRRLPDMPSLSLRS